MKFEELPEIPETWCQFLSGSLPFSPASRAISALIASSEAVRSRTFSRTALCRYLAEDRALCFDRTLDNLRKLERPESVVVVSNFYPALFGGPAFQLFKCLTAIKVCEELDRRGLQAIPVCWISDEDPISLSKWAVRILNAESNLCSFQIEQQETDDFLPGDKMAVLLAQLEESGRGNYDPETLEILRSSFGSQTTLARASARLIAALMKDWGVIVLDPDSADFCREGYIQPPLQDVPFRNALPYSVLPVIATIVDPFEIDSFAAAQAFVRQRTQMSPSAWPQASATIVDSRSRRILKRYGFDLSYLYRGADVIIDEFLDALPRGASEKLGELKLETERRIEALRTLDPGSASFNKTAGSSSEKISYQLDRLKEKFAAAGQRKEETARRQIRRVCNSLAPNGRIQERELAGIQMPLRYSCAILHSLYEQLDILNLEHQLISMD